MSPTAAQLLAEVLRLSEKERGDVAAQLIESLDPLTEENVEAAWGEEIRQRLAELQDERVKPLTWEEARRRILADEDEPASP
jgi:putative addiction module component (TIGR02574 family)